MFVVSEKRHDKAWQRARLRGIILTLSLLVSVLRSELGVGQLVLLLVFMFLLIQGESVLRAHAVGRSFVIPAHLDTFRHVFASPVMSRHVKKRPDGPIYVTLAVAAPALPPSLRRGPCD